MTEYSHHSDMASCLTVDISFSECYIYVTVFEKIWHSAQKSDSELCLPLDSACCGAYSGAVRFAIPVLPTSFWKNPELYSKKSENSYRTILNIQRNRPKNPNTRKIGIKRDLQNPYCSDKIRNFGSTAIRS